MSTRQNTEIGQGNRMVSVLLLAVVLTCVNLPATEARAITLACDGRTDYVIAGDRSKPIMKFAVQELTDHLKIATKADFKLMTVSEAEKMTFRVIVGDNVLSRSIVGADTISALKKEESLVLVDGNDLVLVGGSATGSLYAVYSFLEREVGCRWYCSDDEPFVPVHEKLIVSEVNRREGPFFSHRWGGFNRYYDQQKAGLWALRNRTSGAGGSLGFKPSMEEIGPVHGLHFFVPPHEHKPQWNHRHHPPGCNYFESNPEFFSMSSSGKRVDNLQLCFSNAELRKTLTRQIDSVIAKTLTSSGQKAFVDLSAMDVPGKFCYCPECRKLEQEYGNIGGPYYDYLIELCDFLRREHPGVLVKILAYRKKQTEVPPNNRKMPAEVIVEFAPIDDNFAAPLDHPTNIDTLNNLKMWCKISKNVWVWYYTNYFITGGPAYSDLGKNIRDMKLMAEVGVDGFNFQQATSTDKARGLNFSDLQSWVLLKLCQDPYQDGQKLVNEFADYYFGKAAGRMKEYIAELEMAQQRMTTTLPWNPRFSMFVYLTPEMIVRWQGMFDDMEELAAGNVDHLRNVQTARITLDVTMLEKWRELAKEYPELSVTAKEVRGRITKNASAELAKHCLKGLESRWWGGFVGNLDTKLIKAEVVPKALPEFFNQFSAEDVKQSFQLYGPEDADAACGLAVVRDYDADVPVEFGLYDSQSKKWGIRKTVSSGEIKADRYEAYKLGRTKLTPYSRIWVTTSWIFTVELGEFYVEGDPLVEWDVYMSLKFEGSKYGSKDETRPNRISCDRVILVRQGAGN